MKKNDFYLNNILYWNSIGASYSIIWKFMSLVFHIVIVSVMFRSINHQIYCLILKVYEKNVRKTICCIFGQLKLKLFITIQISIFFNYVNFIIWNIKICLSISSLKSKWIFVAWNTIWGILLRLRGEIRGKSNIFFWISVT
jgi:hypothetical protein